MAPPPWSPEDIRAHGGPDVEFTKHNEALKSIRWLCEDLEGHVLEWEGLDVTHGAQTMSGARNIEWTWQPMLKLMTDASLLNVVGTGIAQVSCKPIPGSYDFRRHAVKRMEQKDEMIAAGIHPNPAEL